MDTSAWRTWANIPYPKALTTYNFKRMRFHDKFDNIRVNFNANSGTEIKCIFSWKTLLDEPNIKFIKFLILWINFIFRVLFEWIVVSENGVPRRARVFSSMAGPCRVPLREYTLTDIWPDAAECDREFHRDIRHERWGWGLCSVKEPFHPNFLSFSFPTPLFLRAL